MNTKIITYAIAFFMLSGAIAQQSSETPLPEGKWELNFIIGLNMELDGLFPKEKPEISFDQKTSKLNGNTSCNDFSVSFRQTGNELELAEDLQQTVIACQGPAEPHFLYTIKRTDRFKQEDDWLMLYEGELPLMRFKKTE
ncbi:META domain-containing protein [Robertkochia aurantiaca]|uniref:META domain-containing protein n=1 Tax=Robertkochia aurantiaca TaxID=2873700 RepID=UPI001CCFE2EE|nr:META domain-containing protein [Robertkochia sp. 3YJGBD-33]